MKIDVGSSKKIGSYGEIAAESRTQHKPGAAVTEQRPGIGIFFNN
jgi:hypothetical protein